MNDEMPQARRSTQSLPESWKGWAFKHATGMGLGAVLGGGIGVGFGVYKHKNFTDSLAIGAVFAALGVISTVGLGHSLYDESFGRLEPKTSFRAKLDLERMNGVMRQR